MTGKVRATCPQCGTVEMLGADVMVLSRLERWHNVYRFDCPTCASAIVRQASPDVVALLLRAGARVERLDHPLPPEDRGDASLPRLTSDDLLDFHDALDRPPDRQPGNAELDVTTASSRGVTRRSPA